MHLYNTTLKSLDAESSFLVCEDIFSGYGSSLYMKFIGSTSRLQQQKAQNSLFSQCETSLSNNSGSIEDRAVKFTRSYDVSNGMTAIFVT